MTEPGGVLMGRVEFERAFAALANRLAGRGSSRIYSSSVAPRWLLRTTPTASRATLTPCSFRIVLDEARRVAVELDLPPWWLNEQASIYVSGKDDPGKRRVFDHPNLRIMVASPEHIFAMKALAARTRDVDDLRHLADLTDVHTVADALRVCRDFYPDEEISPRARGVLDELFE